MRHILNEKKISGRSGHFSIHFFHSLDLPKTMFFGHLLNFSSFLEKLDYFKMLLYFFFEMTKKILLLNKKFL